MKRGDCGFKDGVGEEAADGGVGIAELGKDVAQNADTRGDGARVADAEDGVAEEEEVLEKGGGIEHEPEHGDVVGVRCA